MGVIMTLSYYQQNLNEIWLSEWFDQGNSISINDTKLSTTLFLMQ